TVDRPLLGAAPALKRALRRLVQAGILAYSWGMSFLQQPQVRPPAVARLFYPGDPRSLADEVAAYLDQTEETPIAPGFPKAVIVPHAGYIYSGPVAASAYDLLRPARGIVKRVVILGPCHRVPVLGLALPRASAFDTPLGRIPVDCEAMPVAGMLIAAKRKGLAPKLLDCRNSGDTAGDKSRVVGYASFALASESPRYGAEHGRKLLQIARQSISAALGAGGEPGAPVAEESWLRESRASFVTLMQGDELRGCVGSLEAQRALAQDVTENARAAAFEDARFKPLTPEEFGHTDIEVSLLSTPKRLPFEHHAELIARLRPGVDGIILEQGGEGKRATFLPQVWEG